MARCAYLPHDFTPPPGAMRLPGFVDGMTTFEDHEFHVLFALTASGQRGEATVYYFHGARWRQQKITYALARALKALIDADAQREAFFACYELFRQVDETEQQTRKDLVRAFIAGTLKKERVSGGSRTSPRYCAFIEHEDGARTYV